MTDLNHLHFLKILVRINGIPKLNEDFRKIMCWGKSDQSRTKYSSCSARKRKIKLNQYKCLWKECLLCQKIKLQSLGAGLFLHFCLSYPLNFFSQLLQLGNRILLLMEVFCVNGDGTFVIVKVIRSAMNGSIFCKDTSRIIYSVCFQKITWEK